MSSFSLSMDRKSIVSRQAPQLSISYDACVAWAKIALGHRDDALRLMAERRVIWQTDMAPDRKVRALEEEFYATMQAVAAAAACIDALYDQFSPLAPKDAPKPRRRSFMPFRKAKKNAPRPQPPERHDQIADVLRAAFAIDDDEIDRLKTSLRVIYRLRDASVCFTSTPGARHTHPELEIDTDWRLTNLRGDVADMVVCHVVGLLCDIVQTTECKTDALTDAVAGLRAKMERLVPNGRPTPEYRSVTINIPA